MSEDLKDPNSDLTILSLFALPPDITDEKLLATFTSLRYKKHPISFWQEFELEINLISHIKNKHILKKEYYRGEEILLKLDKDLKAIRHGEHLEVSKWFLRFDLARDLLLTTNHLFFMKKGEVTYQIPISEIHEAFRDAAPTGNPIIRTILTDGSRISIVFAPFTKSSILRFTAIGTLELPHFLEKSRAVADRWVHAINKAVIDSHIKDVE